MKKKLSDERRQVIEEVHAPARRRFPRRHVVVKGFDDLFQADLVEMQPFARMNKGYRYILMVIDAYSKYLWAVPIKDKTGEAVSAAMARVLQERVPRNLQTDKGSEFYNPSFKALMDRHKINHYSTHTEIKAAMVERVNRTLKSAMWKDMHYRSGTREWVSALPKLVKAYNSTRHRTTGMKPVDVTPSTKLKVYGRLKRTAKVHFKVGDHVRVSKTRTVFEKSYTPNWSAEIFTVAQVQRTNPTTYLLKDYLGQDIAGAWYREELQRAAYPDVYLVEKVLRRRGDKAYVKWWGFDASHNSWIKQSSIL